MNIGEYSVRTPVISWLLVIILVGGGLLSFDKMGKLEDPAFTIKNAKVITLYPGASAQEVEDEVTYHIEDAIQRLEQVKRIKMSISRPGMSDISIEFKDKYRADDFPDIYDELRRKIVDMKNKLPPGAQDPMVIDDFGDVYGVYLALTGQGYSWRDLWDFADYLKQELVLVPGIRKVTIGGEQKEVVYVDISRERLGELGISPSSIAQLLQSQNAVVTAGHGNVQHQRLRIVPSGELTSVTAIGDILVASEDKRLIYLRDIASITRAYAEVPSQLYYLNGKPALTLGISMQSGENVVAVGERLSNRVMELIPNIPIGMEIKEIYNQPLEVDKSVSGFLVSVGQAVAIVIVVLLLFMGLRVGLIIGAVLLITVAGTLLLMYLEGIELQRISLGALVIALGMLVDNAIVVAEGMLVRMQSGMRATQAAQETVGKTIWALLGGTIIGILAFSAIGLSQDSTGEFANSLFWVILYSLLLSWVTAISTTPLLCSLLMKPGSTTGDQADDPYGSGVFKLFRNLVDRAIRLRWITVSIVIGLFILAVIGFGSVKQAFFPESNTPMFFVDIWEIEGTDIRATREDTLRINQFLLEQEGVEQTSISIGGGHQRFTLVYDPKETSSVYSQIIVKTDSRERIAEVWDKVDRHMKQHYPWTDPIIKSLRIGPGRDSKIEARFQGPDPVVLRQLSQQAQQIMRADPEAKDIRDDWRQPVKLIRPIFNEQVGRQLGITRESLAYALQYAMDGTPVGQFRDGIRVLPIYMRASEDERSDVGNLRDIVLWSPVLNQSVPAAQVVNGFETVFENPLIRSRDRIQTIIAQCNPTGELATPLFNRLKPQIESMELPPGYSFSWGGEYEDSKNAQAGLASSLPFGFLLMILVSILLFGKLRQPLIIWLTVPLAIVGITAGLLGFNGAFDFMSLLGALSLIGLLIKNAIVLIDEIDQQIANGKAGYEAILDSTVSRLRPVVLAAATTILGLIPLLQDVFFVNMSLTIMAGLGFATLLTLLFVPTLYAILFKIQPPAER
ncbi:MAG: efflux RND transporter permease subunit [Candidatus Thiodiazotropha weberae]|uniref:Multidrug transporter AcrB n=1 Tax=Candidatus Thiodiazotropha endoloripes TaxID=1818881 RepID=A0A1E2USY7_9GAMM|nr:efflux RND transporter permease subunit [Candidatus Thiodiazotropha endoloripes]MCG7900546.1 efflux RND transporter permease subunit [Candidatus Thiodiazotropha weberae]ODB85779.1 multidrug transporter AcrB [Candidatus Thiodiazotropha endoloripes]ODB86583.1 multidrug transporter AcrB [Candidatus Thiodiazotropha endoloripes]ODB88614.1 multidrug transporter AcrB [Candidatus Thiodiazotropha endoloripes]ODB97702.1 multidrug transporter AcrB [Candidatus Thiodiazotropha endoloripes]